MLLEPEHTAELTEFPARPLKLRNPVKLNSQNVLHLPAGTMLITGEIELFNHVDPNDYMWIGKGARSVAKMVAFQSPFKAPPGIMFGLSSFDSSKAQNLRYRVGLENVGQQGFKIAIHTWGDTKIARCAVSWQAIGVELNP